MFENRQLFFKNCESMETFLSEALSFFRKKKVFHFKILAPGTKVNTRDCYFLTDIGLERKLSSVTMKIGTGFDTAFSTLVLRGLMNGTSR